MTNKYTKQSLKALLFKMMILSFIGFSSPLFSQIDTDFWFVVPELSYRGNTTSPTGGTPGTMRFATLELEATVTVSMPANKYDAGTNPTGFQDIVFTIPARETYALDLTHLIDVAAAPGVNRLENKPLQADGINNFGLHITATNMITAYWEIDYEYGSDLWTLKGKNAAGKLFYTPFQNKFPTKFMDPTAYSAIDIVATVDGTEVTILLPPGTNASYGTIPLTITGGVPFDVTLDQGQTFSLFPIGFSGLPIHRLVSARISATEAIAVTLKDDAIRTGPQSEDLTGDQMIPVEILGDNYIIPETKSANSACLIAIEDNTDIYITDPGGVPIGGTPYATLMAGEQIMFDIPGGSKFVSITSRISAGDPMKPFYVYHIATENASVGGALVPSIGCTGNTQLAFTRARANKFYFFIVCKKGNEENFMIDGVPQLSASDNINPDGFMDIAGSGGWVAYLSSSLSENTLSTGQHLVSNTGGIFHLAIINGKPAAKGRLYYGYYSDFGGLNIGANVAGTNDNITRACYGDPVQLYAFGGTNYNWIPDAYLDDGTSNLPTAYNLPPGVHNYTVEVSGGGCGSGSIDLIVVVAEPIDADFTTSKQTGCSPMEVEFTDNCSAEAFSWQYIMEDSTIRYDLDDFTPYPPPPGHPAPFSFTRTYENLTDSAVQHQITLLAKNESGCSEILTRTIVVFPEISSTFSVDKDAGCDPLEVNFTNSSSGDTDRWRWEFGDGGSSTEFEPTHLYRNLFGPGNLFFDAQLEVISPFNCRDTFSMPITVSPYIEAKFAYDTVVACSPHDIEITDQSIGADIYSWDFYGDANRDNSSGPVIIVPYSNDNLAPETYNITLRVDNNEGCFDSLERQVTIYPSVNADFSADSWDICSPGEISFTNSSSLSAVSFLWDFGDGGTSTSLSPVHYYERNNMDHDTVFTVTLVATTAELCTHTLTHDVTVHPYVEAAFTVPDIVGCDPFEITINNEAFGADDYSWDYDDGSAIDNSSAAVILHEYRNLDTITEYHTLELAVKNDQDCYDTLTRMITVHPNISASFIPSPLEGCHPVEVTFQDFSDNVDPDNYLWDFGDGAASVAMSPVHTFTNFGNSDSTYMVVLTTSTSDGECVKQAQWPMVVHPQVDVEFTFEDSRDCNPFEVTFDNLTVGDADFTWDFDDGTTVDTSTTDPQTHIFDNSGNFVSIRDFNVSLYGENSEGCSDEVIKTVSVYPDITASFTAPVIEGCQPLEVDFTNQSDGGFMYVWDFGDGSTSNLQDPTHIFMNTGATDTIYHVKLLSVASNNICEDSFFMDITVHPFIQASFTLPDYLACNPFDVIIENSSINGTQFNWDFGDTNDSITFNNNPFSYRYFNTDYNSQQDYEISLEAVNGFGCTSEAKRTITVEPDIRADFSADNVLGCHPLTVIFTNASEGAAYYVWDFGNGTTSQLADPSQVFTNIGTADTTYHVWLYTIASNNECKDSISLDITVHPYINADFTFQNSINCHPSTVQLNNSSIGGTSYTWTFGDGDPDETTNDLSPVTHTYDNLSYSNIATYDVTLLAQNGVLCSSSVTKTIEVYPDIDAAFTATIYEGCHPLEVDFTNNSQGGFTYNWNFDDGASSDENIPSHTFNNHTGAVITRQVELIAASQYNCKDTITADITIHPKPVARFETDVLIDCPPYDMTLTNTSLYADAYVWDFGDGSATEIGFSVTHEYDNDLPDVETYNLSLTATTNYGCVDEVVQPVYAYPKTIADFSSNREGCSPLTVSFNNESERGNIYLWDFGDGSNLSVTNPINIYHNLSGFDTYYEVLLTSISNYGCVDTKSDTVFVYAQPDAEFTATPTHQNYPNATVSYTNLTGVGAWNYDWDLGDGTSSTLQDPDNHTYSSWGDYSIVLNVSSAHCFDEISHGIRIFPAPPEAEVDSVYPGCEPLGVQFINNTIYASDYLWDFDDGSTSTEFEPFHTFEEAGLYNVKMTVSGSGGIDYAYKTVEVYKMPVIDFKIVPDEIQLPNQAARFFNLTEHADYYLWDFGDGSQSSEVSPEYLYSEIGEYVITLEAWTYDGCYDILTQDAAVIVKGEGELIYPTAFKPDLTGSNGGYYSQMSPELNNIFHPAYEGVRDYKLEIYNRWGQKLFESNDINVGWDGYFNDQLCEQGVYVWQVTGTYQNGDPFRMVGDVTLLHHDNTN